MPGTSGRGPTIDMSPRMTLNSSGSSSILDARSHAPNRKTRGSACAVMELGERPWSTCIVRSLNIVNTRPCRPTRAARYSVGPGLARWMPSAATASSGAATKSATLASAMSTRRLAIAQRPPDGDEHRGGLQTVLVAPGPCAMAQRLERAGMRVGPHFALVARHGRDLLLEGVGDLDPRIRDEAAWVPPFGAAGCVERVDRLDALLDRPGGDEERAEQDLVIAVRIASELAVDDLGPNLAHDPLERRDDLGQGKGVELLVREPETADILDAQRLRGATGMLGLADAVRAVPQRLPFAHDDGGDAIARAGVQRDGPSAPQQLVVGMRRDHQDPLRHQSRPFRSTPVGRGRAP